jgi:hypothetical protein
MTVQSMGLLPQAISATGQSMRLMVIEDRQTADPPPESRAYRFESLPRSLEGVVAAENR